MGLDMYLEGHKFIMGDFYNPENDESEEGFRIKTKIYELGYWRKHHNLHRYIVDNFAGGVDECQEIDLNQEDLTKLIAAIKSTDYLNEEDIEEDVVQEDIAVLTKALFWLQATEDRCYRSVVYVGC